MTFQSALGTSLSAPWCARVLLPLLLLLSFAGAPTRGADDDKSEETWQVIYMAGGRVGFGHLTTRTATREDGQTVVITDLSTYMEINRFNGQFKMKMQQFTEEDEAGNLLSFRFNLENPPVSSSVTTGRVEDGKLHLETTLGGQTTTKTLDWDPEVKSPAWQDRSLKENPLKEGESREFKMFDPQVNQYVTMKLTGHGPASTKMLDGETVQATRVSAVHSLIPIPIDSFLDDSGEVIKTETNLLGLSVATYSVDEATATKELKGERVDLAVETLVKVSPIRGAHDTKSVVYQIEVAGGAAGEQFSEGATQKVTKRSDQEIELTVTSIKPQSAKGDEPAPGEEFLESSPYLTCDDPRIVEHAEKAAGDASDPAQVALAMERYVRRTISNKNYATGLATASEVAEKLEGDCTEHAMLLAAMLRAKEIPSRVAIGLVYAESQSAFAGHMWTEAFLNGQWVPLDATLGQGGIGAAHIKVSDSSLAKDAPSPMAAFIPMIHLIGQMKIEVVRTE